MHLIRLRSVSTRTPKWLVIASLVAGGIFLVTATAAYPVSLNWGRWATEWAGNSVAEYARKHAKVESVSTSVRLTGADSWGNGDPWYDPKQYTATVEVDLSRETSKEERGQVAGEVNDYARSLNALNHWSIRVDIPR